MPLANVEVADDEVTLSAVVCNPAPKVDVAEPKIVVVAVSPTKSRSKSDCCVEDAREKERRSIVLLKRNELSPLKEPPSLNCTCVVAPPGVPEPPESPRDDVATRSYPPSTLPRSICPYVGAEDVAVPPFAMGRTPEKAVAVTEPPLIVAPVMVVPEIVPPSMAGVCRMRSVKIGRA